LHVIKNNFNVNDRGATKSAAPVAIATFATIVNLALSWIESVCNRVLRGVG